MLGTTAAALDLKRRTVSTVDEQQLVQELAYGTLVLGDRHTRARDLSIPGSALAGVFSLRSIDDVHRLRPALDGRRPHRHCRRRIYRS